MYPKLPRRAAVLLSSLGLAFSTCIPSAAADLFVPSMFPTIQGALDAAAPGDQVLVDPGTYNESLNFNQKDVVLRSLEGAESTILVSPVGPSNVPSVRIGPAGSIIGFTIRKPSPTLLGSAIIAQGPGSYIASNIIENHRDGLGANGAGIGMNNASPVIERNIFRNNISTPTALAGVISLLNNSSPYISNNIFHNNSGRAINVTVPVTARPVVVNNTIVNNLTGIRVDTRVTAVAQIYRNNILSGNGTGFQTENGGVANNPTWENNLMFNSVNYSGTTDLTGTAGNISGDPLFEDAAARNFRLLPASPAIDAGSNLLVPDGLPPLPLLDFDMTPRIADGNGDGIEIADIGAFEYTGVVIGSIELTVDGGDVQECLGPQGNTVEARIAVTPDDLELASVELLLNGTSVADSLVSQITLPMGTNLIEAVVVTAAGYELRAQRSVQVVDSVAPVIDARFVDRRTGRELSSIDKNGMTFVTVKIKADDVCDPDPDVESMLGTEIKDGAGLGIIGQANQLRLETDRITLKVMATDASGNVSVQTKQLAIQGKPGK